MRIPLSIYAVQLGKARQARPTRPPYPAGAPRRRGSRRAGS
jgi:hypothetical protein